jgi:hypothetical protein
VKLRLHDTRAKVAEVTRRLLQVLWSNRPLAAQLQFAPPADQAAGGWSG